MGEREVRWSVVLWHRFNGEKFEIREFIKHGIINHGVAEVARQVATGTTDPDEVAWRVFCYVVNNFDYPLGKLPLLNLLLDFHMWIGHLFTKPVIHVTALDFWKLPHETLRDRRGDCEDTSFLCEAMLRVHKLPARAVIGLVKVDSEFYGHAWVEYTSQTINPGKTVIFETTLETRLSPDDRELMRRWFTYVTADRYYNNLYYPRVKFDEERVWYVPEALTITYRTEEELATGLSIFVKTVSKRKIRNRKVLRKLHEALRRGVYGDH